MPPCSAARYSDERDRPDLASTSELSVDLHFGTLSPRRAAVALRDVPGGAAIVRQLAWRDWYAHLLWEHPRLTRHPMRPAYEALQWQNDNEEFEAWCAGTTGYPIVDAGMRQLAATGWMHNRVRMIVASFLVKDLLVDWRWGKPTFVACWWTATPPRTSATGSGSLAPVPTPRRTFGSSTRRHRPKSSTPTVTSCAVGYRNSSTSRAWIHEPGAAPDRVLAEAGVELGTHYPRPIVDHGDARQRTLAVYQHARERG